MSVPKSVEMVLAEFENTADWLGGERKVYCVDEAWLREAIASILIDVKNKMPSREKNRFVRNVVIEDCYAVIDEEVRRIL